MITFSQVCGLNKEKKAIQILASQTNIRIDNLNVVLFVCLPNYNYKKVKR